MVEGLGGGRYLITGIGDPGATIRRVAYAVRDRGRTWVFIDGTTYVIDADARHAGERAHVSHDPHALSAPMPATVIAIKVAPGQDVAPGDLLVLLEAMKMEVPIKAPRAGRVKSLACREGELVQAGVPLVEFE